ncbi:sigma-70 family RNA polymerase sigma factor [Aneurinibacillus sp. Ricciae_BoGa-3]|uniref:RNA polymerase sigma factor n=1 Tax=Aneurinibacillus sp. Ricciae_BoGa-3 TaxID=3022697 RepID=UPI002340C867|nr:sigma-70 family RNA polymerase sigma factor [Aneurinibacillus sp. Ricciae_BoGa-3]WCK53578.1 sigma-70 family RNA polymerase sigma factor [Aneurinibacillus sp. Ricciae_BoGa-3]
MESELYTIVRKAKQGDHEAFRQLIARFKGQVFRHAFAMLHDRMEAEDVTQEAFVKAYYSLHSLDSEYAFASWLTRIVTNLCYTRAQKKKREAAWITENTDVISTTVSGGIGPIERKQMQMTIEEGMERLSVDHRTVIVLRDIQGFTYEEIANILQVPVGTVKSRISAARLSLRKHLETREDC